MFLKLKNAVFLGVLSSIKMNDLGSNVQAEFGKADLRAVASQIVYTMNVQHKSPTLKNLVSYGTGKRVIPTTERMEKLQLYLDELIKQGCLEFKDGVYVPTPSGLDLVHPLDNFTDNAEFRPGKGNITRTTRKTAIALGKLDPNYKYRFQ